MFCSECGAITVPGPFDIDRARRHDGTTVRTPVLRRLWRSIGKSTPATNGVAGGLAMRSDNRQD